MHLQRPPTNLLGVLRLLVCVVCGMCVYMCVHMYMHICMYCVCMCACMCMFMQGVHICMSVYPLYFETGSLAKFGAC